MRLVHDVGDGVVELNYMWLPTFIGMNKAVKDKIQEKIGAMFVREVLDDSSLAKMHEAVIQALVNEFPGIPGLEEYLRAIEHVREG